MKIQKKYLNHLLLGSSNLIVLYGYKKALFNKIYMYLFNEQDW